MKRLIVSALCCTMLALCACDDKTNYDVNGDDYKLAQEDIVKIEKKSPAKFIVVTATDKKNLLGQTVIRGKIENTAKVATFKDVEIKFKFYSRTGALLEEDVETIYQSITPGQIKNFKSKYFTPKGSDSLAIEVLSAKH